MLYILLLAFFLIEFLVIIGVILFAILFSRPEVPLKGDGGLEWTAFDDGDKSVLRLREAEPTNRGVDASLDSRKPMNQLMAAQAPVLAAFCYPSGGRQY